MCSLSLGLDVAEDPSFILVNHRLSSSLPPMRVLRESHTSTRCKGNYNLLRLLIRIYLLPSICFLNETHLMYAIYMIFIKGCNSCVVSRNINGIPSTSRFGDIHLMSIVIQHKGKILILVCKGCYSCVDRVNINGIPIGSIFRDIHLISTKNYTR